MSSSSNLMKALAKETAAGRPGCKPSSASVKASMAWSRLSKCKYNEPKSTSAVDREFLCRRFNRDLTTSSAVSKSSNANNVA